MATFELGRAMVRRDSGSALYAQIAEAMRLRILSGQWPIGHRLLPEPDLAVEIGVSRGTLRKAIAALIQDGLLSQLPGRGTFVTALPEPPPVAQRLSTLAEDVLSQGETLQTTVISCAAERCSPDVAGKLGIRPRAEVMRLIRVRRTSDGPIALLHNYVPTQLAPGIQTRDFATETLFGVLEGRYGLPITSARRAFRAEAATAEVAGALEVAEGTPVQHLEQLTFLADGRPVEYSDVWIDSGRVAIVLHLSRHDMGGTS